MRSKPLGRATQAAITTDGHAFTILQSKGPVRQIKVTVSADAFVGLGSAASVPAASTSNSTYHDTGDLVYTLDGTQQTDGAYLYVWAVTGTTDAYVSYYG
jgi:hypothetical protein